MAPLPRRRWGPPSSIWEKRQRPRPARYNVSGRVPRETMCTEETDTSRVRPQLLLSDEWAGGAGRRVGMQWCTYPGGGPLRD
eukprot:gene974-biopygen3215